MPNGTSDPNNGCDPSPSVPTEDCDGDGVPNGVELDPDGDGTPGPNSTDPNDACSYNQTDVSLEVMVSCNEGVIVYNGITPGGENPKFMIEGINRYPNNTVTIFNRWGVSVYTTQGYNNTTNVFTGESNGRTTVDKESQLPVGTYFYAIEYEKEGQTIEKAGYLYICLLYTSPSPRD